MRTVEDLVNDCGGFGRFQWIFILAVECSLPAQAWSMLFMSFGGRIPEWYCETSDQDNISVTEKPAHFGVCSVNGTSCEHYRYVGDIWSIMKEWNLVCDLKWVKATIISIQMTGVMTGSVIGGQLSDLFGRKKNVYCSMTLLALTNVGTAFSVNWQMFAAGRFLIGFAQGIQTVTSFTYSLEFLPLKWRASLGMLPAFQLSTASFGLLTYLLPNWVYLHLACGISILPVLLGCLWMPESPRWLTVHGRVDEAVAVLQKVARTNGKELPDDARETLQAIAKNEKERHSSPRKYTYLDLFKSWRMARITATFFYFWFSMSLIYYGISFGVSGLSGNIFINIVVMGLLDVPLLAPSFYLTNRCGRRFMVVITFGLACTSAVTCMALMLMKNLSETGTYVNFLSLTARSMAGIGWSVIQAWTSESYPTIIRNLGFGSGNTAARIGSMVAPFLINLDESVVQTYTLIGSFCIFIVILSFTLDETKGKAMSDTFHGKEVFVLEEALPVTPEESVLDEKDDGKDESRASNSHAMNDQEEKML